MTIDAGLKAFATDAGPPRVLAGAAPGSAYRFMGDEHGAVALAVGVLPRLGARITLMPPHCDPTVNLLDWYQVIGDDIAVDRWRVTARGCGT